MFPDLHGRGVVKVCAVEPREGVCYSGGVRRKKLFYLYIFKEKSDSSIYKIGISSEPFKRRSGINASNPNGVEMICCFLTGDRNKTLGFEKLIHTKLKKSKKNGEWFKLSQVEVLGVINLIANNMSDTPFSIDIYNTNSHKKKSKAVKMDRTDSKLIEIAKEIVMSECRASASLLQRKMSLGYARAARLIDILEDQGFVAPLDGSKPREILI